MVRQKNNYGHSFSNFVDPCRTAMIAVQELYKNGVVFDDIESLIIKMCNHDAYMVIEEACRTFSIIGWKSDEVTEKICELLDCQFSVAAEAVFALEKAGKINSEHLKNKLQSSSQAKKCSCFSKTKMFDLESQYILLPIVGSNCCKTGNGSGRGFCYGIKTINFIIGGDGTGDGD